TLWLRSVHADYLLIVDNADRAYFRVELPSGSVIPIELAVPGGGPPEQMSYCTPEPVLDGAGNILFAGGGNAQLTFMLHDPAGGSWSPLGSPLGGIESMHGLEVDGTYVLEGTVGT